MKIYTTFKISENIRETPEGFLLCLNVPIARTGEMEYGPDETPITPGPDGKVIILREAKEVFSPKTIASFEGKALTINHPADFVTPDNWGNLAKGILQNVRRGTGENENDLISDILVTDAKAISLVKNGLREVSCGYEANYIEAGIGRGRQTDIIGNHLALVEAARAGTSYAINDNKRKEKVMGVKEKIKAIFAKAQDEALKVADVEEKEGKEEKPTKDDDWAGYDEMVKMVKDISEKLDVMGKKQQDDASTKPTESKPAEIEAKDDDTEEMGETGLEARLAKLEKMVSMLMERESKEDEVPVTDDDDDMVTDDDGDDMVTDDDEEMGEEGEEVTDSASRVEILVPGMKIKGKDFKSQVIEAAYKTVDGQKVIHQFTGGKAPNLKDKKQVDLIFIGASEVLKEKRNAALAQSKSYKNFDSLGTPKGAMTAEELNKKNQEFYKNKGV